MKSCDERTDDFTSFLDDRSVHLSNNAAEIALRGIALRRRNWIFAGPARRRPRRHHADHDHDAHLNDVDPKAWPADVLTRIADLPASRPHELLPREWKLLRQANKPADQQGA